MANLNFTRGMFQVKIKTKTFFSIYIHFFSQLFNSFVGLWHSFLSIEKCDVDICTYIFVWPVLKLPGVQLTWTFSLRSISVSWSCIFTSLFMKMPDIFDTEGSLVFNLQVLLVLSGTFHWPLHPLSCTVKIILLLLTRSNHILVNSKVFYLSLVVQECWKQGRVCY